MTAPLLRIGTRGSPLALAQATTLAATLRAAHPALVAADAIETVVIRTTGDQVRDRTLAEIGGKGLFTKEIEEALLANRIDVAVHSLKDVATALPAGLVMAAHLPRADPHDAFLSQKAPSVEALPQGAVVGTASLRRRAQLLHRRPDLHVVPMRGNVDTRLRKLESGVVDATVLAVAGMRRLGLDHAITAVLPVELMLPAPAQGIIAAEARADDRRVLDWLAAIDDAATAACAAAERSLLAVLDGSCRTPIAALAEIVGDRLHLLARIISTDGKQLHEAERIGPIAAAAAIGEEAGVALRRVAGPGFFDQPLPGGVPV